MIAAILAALLVAAPAQQRQQATKKPSPGPIVLVGCVGGGKGPGDPLTLTSLDSTVVYRLTGRSLRRYLGQRVQIVGRTDSRRFTIVGGLRPSPNVAAQAGALDPAAAAVAASPLSTADKKDQDLPAFRVKSAARLEGACE